MSIVRNFNLCLNAGTGSAPFINVSQTDRDETWLFKLYTETGERYIPSSGAIIGIKADGHGIANTGTVDSEGRVVITETEQITAAAGIAIYELSIDGLTHGTANFIVNVEKKPIDGAIMSDSDLSLISQAIDSAAVIVDVIGDSDPSEVIGEHVDAWLDNHPEATTTVEDGAITAPKINNSLWDKLLVSEEASGAVASFDDGADDVPVSSLKVALEPIQTGTGDPSPTNVRPIIASNGKNLLQNVNSTRTQNGITYTVNADGSVTATGTATSASYFVFTSANNSINDYTVTIIPSGTSIIASTDSTKVLRVRYTDGTYENLTNGSAKTLTKNIGLVLVEYSSGTTANETIKPMIRLASITDPSYQPYQGILVERAGENVSPVSYTISLGRAVYGGTVDLATGVLTVDKVLYTFTGNENPYIQQTGRVAIKAFQGSAKAGSSAPAVCSHFVAVAGGEYAYITTAMTDAELKTFMANNTVTIAYNLETPQTINLTPQEVKTLLGYNNISSSGTVDVIYHADTQMYVEKEVNKAKSIIAGIEAEFKATKNYTTGDLLIIGDDLYKCTANIANGGTITVNTNVTKTTVAEQLIALA